jgi:superfamily II DNA or RNA helicase
VINYKNIKTCILINNLMELNMDIQSFLPNYPDILAQDNGEFNNNIFRKKEFYDLKLEQNPPTTIEKGMLLKQQTLISRFLSPYTLYDELLLFHYPGVGKTCTAIATAEMALNAYDYLYEQSIKKIIIIVPNKELVRFWAESIIFTCTNDKYKHEFDEDEIKLYTNDGTLNDRSLKFGRKNIKEYYRLFTHETFYNHVLKNLPIEQQIKHYSNSVIIIDEVHKITNTEMYQGFYEFLHLIQNRKILLMTGTPMTNEAFEIARVMNLILPFDKQLPEGKFFDETYFTTQNTIKTQVDENLENSFKGRVSYLKADTNIHSDYVEKIPLINFNPPIEHFKLFYSYMSDHQFEIYKKYLSIDSKEEKLISDNFAQDFIFTGEQKSSSFLRNQQEASLFVYPDGTYGQKGFKKYIKKENKNIITLTEKYHADFLTPLKKLSTDNEKLSAIKKYSSKYGDIIEQIITHKDQNVFVFNKSISGSGSIILGLCLEVFGYSRMVNKINTKALRYCIFSNDIKINFKDILSIFNSSKNKNGEYIQVLIGGFKINIGFTFHNIQQIHIASPHWNFSAIDQAIARGIRAFSHKDLSVNTLVRIFLHVSLYPNIPIDKFIDIIIYRICENKDVKIKQIEYFIKRISFDCPLTYDRNLKFIEPFTEPIKNYDEFLKGTEYKCPQDNSRACEYNDCFYTCKNININPPYKLNDNELHYDTYSLYYWNDSNIIIKKLKTIFKTTFYITTKDLFYNYLHPHGYTLFQFYQTLFIIIKKSIVFINKYGFNSYLKEDDDVLYLTNDILSSNNLSSYYAKYPTIKMNIIDDQMETIASMLNVEKVENLLTKLQKIVEHMMSKNIMEEKELLSNEIFNKDLNSIFEQFSAIIQETFIENAIIAHILKHENILTIWILSKYKDFIDRKSFGSKNIYYSRFILQKGEGKLRQLTDDNIWINLTNEQTINTLEKIIDQKEEQTIINEEIRKLIDQLCGFYNKNKQFSIKLDVKNNPRNKGRVCLTYKKQELMNISQKLDIPLDKNDSSKDLCDKIEKKILNCATGEPLVD